METITYILAILTMFVYNDYTRQTYLGTGWREDDKETCIVLSVRRLESLKQCNYFSN